MVKNSFVKMTYILVHIGIASMRQFQCVPATYVTENKENHLEICTYIFFASFKHLVLPISTKIPVPLLLDDIYVSKFEFMNYLLLTW